MKSSDVISKTTNYYFGLLDNVVDEVGEKYVVHVVTNNEGALKAVGKKLIRKIPHLYWKACSAHCINLILHEISKKNSIAHS